MAESSEILLSLARGIADVQAGRVVPLDPALLADDRPTLAEIVSTSEHQAKVAAISARMEEETRLYGEPQCHAIPGCVLGAGHDGECVPETAHSAHRNVFTYLARMQAKGLISGEQWEHAKARWLEVTREVPSLSEPIIAIREEDGPRVQFTWHTERYYVDLDVYPNGGVRWLFDDKPNKDYTFEDVEPEQALPLFVIDSLRRVAGDVA